MHRWFIGGMVGGAAGIAVWVAVGYFAQYEIGWIAWGIGFVVGAGVRYGAYLGDEEESETQGMVAGALAVGSIVLAKYILFCMLVGNVDTAGIQEAVDSIRFDEEAMVASAADEIAGEMIDGGQSIEWPAGMNYEDASRQADYPAEIWQQAQERWNALPEVKKQEQKRQRLELASALSEMAKASNIGFTDFFSPWDALWFGLAAITAYKLGVGTYGAE